METQQMIALALVAAAALYLVRQLAVSARSFFSARSGCSSGCGKCGFARELGQKRASSPGEEPHIIRLNVLQVRPNKTRHNA